MSDSPDCVRWILAAAVAVTQNGWLKKGFLVDAIDMSEGMLNEAEATNAHPNVAYFQDSMPALEKVREKQEKYDVITLSAVWMHLSPEERAESFRHILEVAKPGAVVLFTLRHGPSPEDRPMFEVSVEELKKMAAYEMVECEHALAAEDDKLGRGDVWWENVYLKTPHSHLDALANLKAKAIQRPDRSIKESKLLLSVADALRQYDAQHIDASRVSIPFRPVAETLHHLQDIASIACMVPPQSPHVNEDHIMHVIRDDNPVFKAPLNTLTDKRSGHPLFVPHRSEHGDWHLSMPADVADAIDTYRPLVVSSAAEVISQRLQELAASFDRPYVERYTHELAARAAAERTL